MIRRILFLLSFVPLIPFFMVMAYVGIIHTFCHWLRVGKLDDEIIDVYLFFMDWPFMILGQGEDHG